MTDEASTPALGSIEPADGADAPVFHAPWQARAFAVAVALSAEGTYEWATFQERLAAEIDRGDDPAVPADEGDSEAAYYRRWLAALERLLLADDVLEEAELLERAAEFAAGDRDASEWIEGDRPHSDHSHPHDSSH